MKIYEVPQAERSDYFTNKKKAFSFVSMLLEDEIRVGQAIQHDAIELLNKKERRRNRRIALQADWLCLRTTGRNSNTILEISRFME